MYTLLHERPSFADLKDRSVGRIKEKRYLTSLVDTRYCATSRYLPFLPDFSENFSFVIWMLSVWVNLWKNIDLCIDNCHVCVFSLWINYDIICRYNRALNLILRISLILLSIEYNGEYIEYKEYNGTNGIKGKDKSDF